MFGGLLRPLWPPDDIGLVKGGKAMETRGSHKKLTEKQRETAIQRIFQLRLQLIALVERFLADGVDPDAIEAEILMREQISGRAH